MPPDAPLPARTDTGWSSRNALRGGVLAALSSAEPAPVQEAARCEAEPAEPMAGQEAAPPVADAVEPPRRPLGLASALRAAGRSGLRSARPLAMPFLHRFQMRVGTAVDASGLAARVAGIEAASAASAVRAEEAAAQRFEAMQAKLDAVQQGADAAFRQMGPMRSLLGVALDRIGAAQDRIAAVREEFEAAQGRIGSLQNELDEALQRLDAVQRGVAAVPDLVGSRVPPRAPIPLGDDFLVYTPDGVLLVPAEDQRFLAVIADGGVLEAGTRRVLAALLRPGGVFLDVGANVGTMALLAARAVGPAGRVVAVEPTPRIAALLRRSMAVNDVADRVAVEECAAGDAEGEALLHLEEIMSHNTLFPLGEEADGRGTLRVRVRPADDLVPAGTPVAVAKIDAEGAELQVWRGMRRILAESPVLAAVLEFGPSHLARVGVTPEAWLREVEAPGFEPYMIDDLTGVCRPATVAALAGVFSANVLLLRPAAAARHPDLAFA